MESNFFGSTSNEVNPKIQNLVEKILESSIWRHSLGVYHTSMRTGVALKLPIQELNLLGNMAILHDVGKVVHNPQKYPHQISGYLALRDIDRDIANACLYHSAGELYIKKYSGLNWTEFPLVDTKTNKLISIITDADRRTGKEGELFTPEERLKEILSRYPKDSEVYEFETDSEVVLELKTSTSFVERLIEYNQVN